MSAKGPYYYQLPAKQAKRPLITALAAQVLFNENQRYKENRKQNRKKRERCPKCGYDLRVR